MSWYYIDTGYATFGIAEKGGIIKITAPIGKWMIGKNIIFIKQWVKSKRGTIIKLEDKYESKH